MTLEELKALFIEDGGYSPKAGSDALVELAPEILALVEELRSRDTGEHDLPKDVRKALYDFNAKLEAL